MELVEKKLRYLIDDNGNVRLPKSGTNSRMRERLGLKVLEEGTDWFYLVKLPRGWKVVVYKGKYEDEVGIIDEKRRKRIRLCIELKYDGSILECHAEVLTRFYTEVIQTTDERRVLLFDREKPDFVMNICVCNHENTVFNATDCATATMLELEKYYPGCNDYALWDDNPLEHLEKV